jgi:hypothetical protein
MEILGIGLATLIIVLWLVTLLLWLVSFGTTLENADAWPDSSIFALSRDPATGSAGSQTAA